MQYKRWIRAEMLASELTTRSTDFRRRYRGYPV
jgi:hypothetical protein